MPDGVSLAPATAERCIVTDEPVLIFGGCYSNLQATRALLAAAERWRIPPERMICTGDVIAYGADPAATLALIRDAGIATVMGNCEESLAAEAGDCGCGFAPGSTCELLAAAWFTHASRRVSLADRHWMGALPRRITLLLAGRQLAVVHGAPSRINRFVFDSTPDAVLAEELALTGAEGVIGGHCGLPFTRRVDGKLWHNSGAIGLPANDGTPRGWYSVLTPRPEGIEIRHLPLDYDHAGAAQAMRAAGLPEGYAAAMERGIWPSFDVLPAAEQAATAASLAPMPRLWGPPPPPPRPPRPTAEAPAKVALRTLETLWFNTGSQCNIACTGCFMDSSPRNDHLSYLSRAEFDRFLAEARGMAGVRMIGFTGGEPFLNRDVPGMIEAALAAGFSVLVLTNAMRPMQRVAARLAALGARFPGRLAFRVSLDHYSAAGHEAGRGSGSFAPALAGLGWLARSGLAVSVAARLPAETDAATLRAGFAALFAAQALPIDAADPAALVLFPELTDPAPPPPVGAACWQALHGAGRNVMCETSRMVVHRRGEAAARVAACTLLPEADLGATLAEAGARAVALSHPHCARFCVFGEASCGGG